MLSVDHPMLKPLTHYIATYLSKQNRKLAPPYVEIYMHLDIARKRPPGIVNDFMAALDEAMSAHGNPEAVLADIDSDFFSYADYRHTFIEAIITSGHMQWWQREYSLRIFSRAGWIAASLEYVELVGPYLGRSLLCIRNPHYQLIIAMRLYTTGAFRTTGILPDTPAVGEEREQGAWSDPQLPWKPISLEVIKAYVVMDHFLGCGWFPDQRLSTSEQIREWVGTAYQNTRRVIQKLASPNGPLVKYCNAYVFEGNKINQTHVPALATAFSVGDRWVRSMSKRDAWAQSNLKWSPVKFQASVRERIKKLILLADTRARDFSLSPDLEIRAIGERILDANVQLLVYAAVLYGESQGDLSADDAMRICAVWPFVVPDMPAETFSRNQWKDKLIYHLGYRNRSEGRKRVDIWCTAQ